jgi:hypothetical protein
MNSLANTKTYICGDEMGCILWQQVAQDVGGELELRS